MQHPLSPLPSQERAPCLKNLALFCRPSPVQPDPREHPTAQGLGLGLGWEQERLCHSPAEKKPLGDPLMEGTPTPPPGADPSAWGWDGTCPVPWCPLLWGGTICPHWPPPSALALNWDFPGLFPSSPPHSSPCRFTGLWNFPGCCFGPCGFILGTSLGALCLSHLAQLPTGCCRDGSFQSQGKVGILELLTFLRAALSPGNDGFSFNI